MFMGVIITKIDVRSTICILLEPLQVLLALIITIASVCYAMAFAVAVSFDRNNNVVLFI